MKLIPQNTYYLLISFLLCISFFSCQDKKNNPQNVIPSKKRNIKEELVKTNQYMVAVEDDEINNYIYRHKWEVKKTGTGLRYWIYKNGNGEIAMPEMVATIKYKASLINGQLCYSSEETGPKVFLIGKSSRMENGIHEGVTYMRVGDKAKFIIPSHLAHGFIGDQNKIPRRATIIYDIELTNLKTQ